jgi:hypothetical protein
MNWVDGQMLGTILGGIIGFIAAVLPNVFARMQEVLRHQREMDMGAQQIEAAKAGVQTTKFQPYASSAPDEVAQIEVERARDAEAEDDEAEEPPNWVQSFMASLRAGVRPLITYAFFVVFTYVKLKAMYQGYYVDHTPAIQLLPVIWDSGTQTLFSAVLAFWFGSRAFDKEQDAQITARG